MTADLFNLFREALIALDDAAARADEANNDDRSKYYAGIADQIRAKLTEMSPQDAARSAVGDATANSGR